MMNGILEFQELNLPQGPIKGAKRETIYGLPYYSFEGIPYAKPPLGDLRFKAPQTVEPWSEILDCTTFRSKPLQKAFITGEIEGSEDCLYLNVYAKKLQSIKPLPVMIWIYGGAYAMGEATRDVYGPDYFMAEDVILVTFNYRLGSLGFLSLQDPALKTPGNAALKDQVLAIKWVKKYISHFNGNPENMTLFGESAGACSSHYMMLTEQTQGLFQRAILMSGCALSFLTNNPQTDMAYRLAKCHGYDGENKDESVLNFLQKLPAEKLVEHDLFTEEERRNGYLVCFGPIIEPYIGDDCVVPKSPFEMIKTTWSNSIPIMIGGTSEEGIFMYPKNKFFSNEMNEYKTDIQRFLPVEVRDRNSVAENDNLSLQIKKLHFGDKEPNENCLMEFFDFYSYKIIWHALLRTIFGRLKYARNTSTYLYRFNFDSPTFNLHREIFGCSDIKHGVCHADELCYLFFSNYAWKLEKESLEFKTIQRMISLWTSFAKNSKPNCVDLEETNWKPLEAKNPYLALNISKELKFMDLPEKDKLQVWIKMDFSKDEFLY